MFKSKQAIPRDGWTLSILAAFLLVSLDVAAEIAPSPPSTHNVWTTARKVGVGTAFEKPSKVWFTLADGMVTEVYWPQIDMAQVTDLQFLVTDGSTWFDEEKKDTSHKVEYLDDRSLAYRLINTDPDGRYVITKEIVTDPERDSLVMHVTFDPKVNGLKLYLLLNPAASNTGLYDYAEAKPDTLYAWDDRIKFASGDPEVGQVQALIGSMPFKKVSAGFVGFTDCWQDLHADFTMNWTYDSASNGNVALTAQLDVPETTGAKNFDLVLGFARDKADAESVVPPSRAKECSAFLRCYNPEISQC